VQRLAIVGAPSSAGAYAPGQERAPAALRAAGLRERLSARGVAVDDRGDVPGFRWRIDRSNPRAMNVDAAASVAAAVADEVAAAFTARQRVLVLGGDCTVELGTVAGALRHTPNVGLVYVDLDTDLNTPRSTTDGALDWMGVAHMLDLEDAVPALTHLGPRVPLLQPEQVLLFASGNAEPFEREVIARLGLAERPLEKVAADPSGVADEVVTGWARSFDHLLIHLDVDVLDFADVPLAENTRRNVGLRFDQLVAAMGSLLRAPNWSALTVCELNPDHGDPGGETVRTFVEALVDAISPAR
jgi:arginase